MRWRLVVAALVVAGVLAFLLTRGPGPAGELGEEIAHSLGCGGGTVTTEETNRQTPEGARIFKITCKSGHVNPVGTLFRFESANALQRFLVSPEFGKRRIGKERICLTEADAFDDAIAGIPRFQEFCSEHGGTIYCGDPCQERKLQGQRAARS